MTHVRKLHPIVFLLIAALMLSACATAGGNKAVVVSGESLDAAGKQFVEVGRIYNQMLDAKQVTPEQYREWAAFAKKFQKVYPVAVAAWKSARAANDLTALDNVSAQLGPLLAELSRLAFTAFGVASK